MTEDNHGECLAEVATEPAMVAEVAREEYPTEITAEQAAEAELEPTSASVVDFLPRAASVATMVDVDANKPISFEGECSRETATEQAMMTGSEPAAIVPSPLIVVPSDVASSSGVTLADIMISEEDTAFGHFTGPYATALQVLVELFFGILRAVMPLLLQDGETSDAILLGLEGSLASLKALDATLADCLQQLITKLRALLNQLQTQRLGLEAFVDQFVAVLRAQRASDLQDVRERLEAEEKWSMELSSTTQTAALRHRRSREAVEEVNHQITEVEQALLL